MSRWPLPNLFMATVLVVLAAVQLGLVYEFWGSFASGDPYFTFVFQACGICLALIEMVCLIVASNAANSGKVWAAGLFRGVFVGLFLLNLACDIGAVATFTRKDADARAHTVAVYSDAETRATETNERILSLHASLAKDDIDVSPAAIQAQLDAASLAVEQSGISGNTLNWRQQRVAKLQAALVTANEIASLETARAGARAETLTFQGQPSVAHPQIAILSVLAGWAGITVDPETMRTILAVALAVVLRGVLALGFWLASPAPGGAREFDGGSQKSLKTIRDNVVSLWPWPGSRKKPTASASPPLGVPVQIAKPDPRSTATVTPLSAYPRPRPETKKAPEPPPARVSAKSARPHGGKGHDPKTCPTCSAPVGPNGRSAALFDALDDFDPKN